MTTTSQKTEWKETTLGDVCDIESGGTPSTKDGRYWDGDIPWITPRDLASFSERFIIRGNRSITAEGLQNSSSKRLPKNTVLFSSRAPIGYVAIAANELVTNQGFKNFVCDEVRANYLFIYYWLKTNASAIEKRASGSTFAEVSATVLKSQSIILPPLDEQRSIASVLSSMDDKINLLRRQNETLEKTAQAIFNEWFVKPSINQVSVAKVVEFNPATVLQKGTIAPYFDMGKLPIASSWPSAPIMRKFTSGSKFQNGDTLLARITPCLENGKTAFMQRLADDQIAWGSTEFIVMRAKEPFTSILSYLLARTPSFRDFAIHAMSGTSGRQRVQVDMLSGYTVALPEKDVIEGFSCAVEAIFTEIKHNSEQSGVLASIRDTLLPRLMNGGMRL